MNYTEVKIYISKDDMEPLTYALTCIGIGGFVMEDPDDFHDLLKKKKGYEWDYIDVNLYALENIPTSISFYLEDTPDGLETLDRVTYICQDYNVDKIVIGYIKDDEWKYKWKEFFKPARVAERLIVKPSWEEYQRENDDDLIIEIDPGMAFGTGTHPTTVLCLEALGAYVNNENITVLDVGCGSAILSIAAALLGAKHTKGIDIDPEAVKVAKSNVILNGMEKQIEITAGDLTNGILQKYDIVVANLMADLIVMLSQNISSHLKEKGIYISSGILIEKKEGVISSIQQCGFEILDVTEKEEWCAIIAQKK